MRLHLSAFVGLTFAFSIAQASTELLSYLVFAKQGIQSQSSDYQGATGAMGAVDLTKFEIVGHLESTNSIRLVEGSVKGQSRAPRVTARRASVHRASFTQVTERKLSNADRGLDTISARLSAYPSTSQALRTTDGISIVASRSLEVVDIDEATFASAASLHLEGDGRSLLLVRIRGAFVNFQNKGVFVSRGLRPEQVVFYFPDALEMELSYSGGAKDPASGLSWGIPGSIVAPLARVHFAEILVTGKFYVGSICTRTGLNGGQVNAADSVLLREQLGCPCVSR